MITSSVIIIGNEILSGRTLDLNSNFIAKRCSKIGIKLCEIKNKNIVNYYMLTRPLENYNFKYLYLLKKGISKIKGGLKVLIDLDYPKEILENAHLTLTKM